MKKRELESLLRKAEQIRKDCIESIVYLEEKAIPQIKIELRKRDKKHYDGLEER